MGLPLTAHRAASPPLARTASRVSWRGVGFAAIFLAYALLTVGVLVDHSPVLTLDQQVLNLHVQSHHPQFKRFVLDYVMFGQRGPATLAFLPFFIWMAWRRRSSAPLVMLVTSLILLNVSVGIVKYATGRIGPAHVNDVHLIFAGGNIYPSGHVSNTVVLYGLIAWLVPRWRKTVIALAVFLCLTVGLGTIYLRTHWLSDVVGGWLAGALVLVALPTVMPAAQRWADAAVAWARRRRVVRRPVPVRPALQRNATPVSSPARSHSFAATVSSLDALDEPTRCG